MPIDFMASVTDNARLVHRNMRVTDPARTEQQVVDLVKSGTGPCAPHGRRHSQGGQTLLEGGLAVDIESLQRIEVVDRASLTVRIGAGAAWSDLHLALAVAPAPNGGLSQAERDVAALHAAPRTHQSSPLFSVGGSLSVNCHGRHPTEPPLAGTVVSLTLVDGQGTPRVFDRDAAGILPAPARAALGGYGACGIITSAVLSLKPERQLKHTAKVLDRATYVEQVLAWDQKKCWPAMHYGWLDFSGSQLFDNVVSVDSGDIGPADRNEALIFESPLSEPIRRLEYALVRRTSGAARDAVWKTFLKQGLDKFAGKQRTINALRPEIQFTRFVDDRSVDLLQEFFVPIAHLGVFLERAKTVLTNPAHRVNLLSSTIRYMSQDSDTLLSYARSPGTTASVIVNANVRNADLAPAADGVSHYQRWNRELIELVIELGGAFYLPYWRCATRDQFRRAFPAWQDFKTLADQMGRDSHGTRRFDSDFLRTYL